AAFGLAGGGLVLVSIALGIELQDANSGDFKWYLIGAGTAAALLSVIPTILTSKTYDGAIQHDLALHMFTSREWGQRMSTAMADANAKLAAECQAAPDLPTTPAVQRMLGTH